MATGPTISSDPLELLTPDLSRPEPLLNKYYGGGMTSALCLVACAGANYALKRPVFSSLHAYAIMGVGGFFAGNYVDNLNKAHLAERDAVLRHYIQLHPEDFPREERKKYSELLLPWHPVR